MGQKPHIFHASKFRPPKEKTSSNRKEIFAKFCLASNMRQVSDWLSRVKPDRAVNHQVTISIPEGWQQGASLIQRFIEHYTEAVGLQVAVSLRHEDPSREIWITDAGKLSQQEYEAVEIAIQTLNEGLARLHGEFPWSAEKAAGEGLLSRLAELNKVFSKRE